MRVKEVMSKTLKRYYESDCIYEASESLLEMNDEGGLVYNAQDKLIGYFTYKEIISGMVKKHKFLCDVLVRDFFLIEESTIIQHIEFAEHELLPVMDSFKDVTGFILKKRYLNAIAKRNEVDSNRLDAIFKSAHNGILSIDVEGRITTINPAAVKMALTTKEQAVGKFLNEIVSPTGLLNVIRTGQGHTEKYTVGKRKYLAHRTPIYDGKQLVGAVGVFQDISEVELISNELNSVKQLVSEMETVINNSSDGICIVDSEGNIIRKNERFNDLYFEHLDEEKKKSSFHKIIAEVVHKKKKLNTLEKGTKNDNSIIISADPVSDEDGEVERVIFNVKDMTEIDALRQEVETTQFILKNIQDDRNGKNFVANSDSMKNLLAKVEQASQIDVTVLLTGETGVGKEEIAKLIMESGPRRNKPFIKVNCSAVPEQLMESELFGYADAVFADAYKEGRAGLFEHADGGTLFLDEIEAMPLPIQIKFLQVLKEQEVTRVGSSNAKKVDVRIIIAANENLEELVADGKFREDLFYRINVIPIVVPPLRERVEDIPDLIKFHLDEFSKKYKKSLQIHDDALERLLVYDWPDNVRELINILERLSISTSDGVVALEQLEAILGETNRLVIAPLKPIVVNRIMPLKEAVEELERELIAQVGKTEDSYRKIAKVLEVNPSTIARKMKRLEGG